jgi:hypothetical protein
VTIKQDSKDWTWVLTKPCPECGFEAGELHREDIGTRLLQAAKALRDAALAPGATERPAPDVWSPLEYACHTRDACQVFDERLQLMLSTDEPVFANWDQDAAAADYPGQDPTTVAAAFWTGALDVATRFNGLDEDDWERSGTRSNGSEFTVVTLGQYFVHDLAHHAWDVTGVPQLDTPS